MKKRTDDHLGLLADTGLIASLIAGRGDVQTFLERCVDLVADALDADVCSIYLREESSHDLVLRATRGLNLAIIGKVRLAEGEGLVGLAIKELRPIHTANASRHPGYRHVPGSGEDPFETFLAVPVLRGVEKVGVLVVQRKGSRVFRAADIKAMQVLVLQLAAAIENARVLLGATQAGSAPPAAGVVPRMVRGQPVAPGCAHGPAHVMTRDAAARILEKRRESALPAEGPCDLDRAVEATIAQLQEGQDRLGERLPEAASLVFESHLMMLNDVGFIGRIRERMAGGMPPGRAVADVADEYIKLFEASDHDYMREKARDVEDIALRLLDNLAPDPARESFEPASHIVIARELLPSDILRIAQADAGGIVLLSGGSTAHVSLLVRSLGIPMVILDAPELLRVRDATMVIVDADAGNVYVDPAADVLASFEQRARLEMKAPAAAARMRDQTRTRDGQRVYLQANINLLSELDPALRMKAEGVGLYRTEFPFLVRPDLPSELDQQNLYARLLDRMQGRPVTFRTLDAGGDKVLSYFDIAPESNPALGLRSTRLTLKFPEIFDQQLRAILRAARNRTDVQIMFPMIGSLEELRAARARFDECVAAVATETGVFTPPRLGMMVELPAVVELAAEFAAECDFFSIGTNDFIQYMLAVDRTNANVAEYSIAHHPSVLRGIRRIVDAARQRGIEVTVCGEMAHDVRYIPFFVGLGIRYLSVDPSYLPGVQAAVAGVSMEEARAYAQALLSETSIQAIEARLRPALPASDRGRGAPAG